MLMSLQVDQFKYNVSPVGGIISIKKQYMAELGLIAEAFPFQPYLSLLTMSFKMTQNNIWQAIQFASYGEIWLDVYREWLKCIHENETCNEPIR